MGIRATGIAIALALACAAPAAAQSPYPPGQPYAPWDGTNPFNCVLQDAGTGTVVPDPGADPYCVEFDKTQQNVTDFGIFAFLANEPARFGAAGPKCFYFQSDHWTGSVVQGTPPELWHWDGQYFFDKAFGVGGVNVQNFRIGGQPASPSDYGQVPPEFAPYMNQSGGGSYIISQAGQVDPNCAVRVDTPEEQAQVYAHGPPPLGITSGGQAAAPPAARSRCQRRKGKRKKHAAQSRAKKRGKCGKRKRKKR